MNSKSCPVTFDIIFFCLALSETKGLHQSSVCEKCFAESVYVACSLETLPAEEFSLIYSRGILMLILV